VSVALSSSVAEAYRYCEEVARRSGSSFYRAFWLLDRPRRRALAALYAFCRFCDDCADEPGGRAALLARWRGEIELACAGRGEHPVTLALGDAIRRFGLRRDDLEAIVRGVEMDFEKRRYATFAELRQYCYHVASAVGLVSIEIFGYSDPSARKYAENLGIALQLTNILRDLAEDAERGRIYLPQEDLERFDYRERDLFANRETAGFKKLMAFEAGRCRQFYGVAVRHLAPIDRPRMVAAEAMRMIYQRLLGRLEASGFRVFGPRLALPASEKLACAAMAWLACNLRVAG